MWSFTSLHNPILQLPLTSRAPNPRLFSLSEPHFSRISLSAPDQALRRRSDLSTAAKAPGGSKEGAEQQKWTSEGLVTESLPNGMFRVKLDNSDMIIGYICGKIRKSFIRILPGDRVKVERGHVRFFLSQIPIHPEWKTWLHVGKAWQKSSGSKSSRQITQSLAGRSNLVPRPPKQTLGGSLSSAALWSRSSGPGDRTSPRLRMIRSMIWRLVMIGERSSRVSRRRS